MEFKIVQRIVALCISMIAIACLTSCESGQSKKTGYELDWVASEIEQSPLLIYDGQSMPVLTVRMINHTKEPIGIILDEGYHNGAFYLIDDQNKRQFYDTQSPRIRVCQPSDTLYIYLGRAEEHALKIEDEEVEKLLPGRLYYWPDPQHLEPGVLSDSIEIKKVADFHSATCPMGRPYYMQRYPDKSP